MSEKLLYFDCPVCQTNLKTHPDHADHHVICIECSSELVVPDPPMGKHAPEKLMAEEAPMHLGGDHGEVEMDMTPMVDVTFLLLIFFMVTAAFTMQKSFEVPTPEDERPSTNVVQREEEEGVITVRIDEYNTFHVSSTDVDPEEAPNEFELIRKLRDVKAATDGANTLIVEAHVECKHANVVMAMDMGTELEMAQVKLRTIEDDG